MKEEVIVYENSRVHPEDLGEVWARRVYSVRDSRHAQRVTGERNAGRNYKNAFEPAREPQRFIPGRTWRYGAMKLPERRGRISMLDVGPYRGHDKQAAKCKCQCDCGQVLFIFTSQWASDGSSKPPPDQCEACRRKVNHDRRGTITRAVTLALAKR